MKSTRVKICGITSPGDARLAAEAGADAIGMILWAKSPRLIDTDRAFAVVQALPPFVAKVGVFVDASPAFVAECARKLPLDYVQLHGRESLDYIRALQSFRVIRAITAAGLDSLGELPPNVAAILADSGTGGTGVQNDWPALARAKPTRPLIAAGGLSPDNVADVIRRVRPYAVDVSSGVESEPAIKSADKLRAFVRAVHSAGD